MPSGFSPLGLLMIPVGVLGGALAFLWNRRRGSNEVAGAGGAADAAFGGLPAPGTSAATLAGAPTRRVTDAQLAAMATIEFVPPRGLEPWMGRALLREFVDQDTVVAWFSEMIAQEAMVITTDGDAALARTGAATRPGERRRPEAHRPALPQGVVDRARHLRRDVRRHVEERVPGATGLHPRLRLVEFDDREGRAASPPASSVR